MEIRKSRLSSHILIFIPGRGTAFAHSSHRSGSSELEKVLSLIINYARAMATMIGQLPGNRRMFLLSIHVAMWCSAPIKMRRKRWSDKTIINYLANALTVQSYTDYINKSRNACYRQYVGNGWHTKSFPQKEMEQDQVERDELRNVLCSPEFTFYFNCVSAW